MLDYSKNYFELFGLPLSFAVDAKRLAERYLALQGLSDPDRFAVAADHEKRVPYRASTQVKEAYRTLKDPLARARYLLGLYDPDPGAECDTRPDGAFLMERMELGAILAAACNGPNPGAAVARVLTQLAERSAALDKKLEGLFADPTEANLATAREILRQLEFLDLCRRDAEGLDVRLDPRC